MTTSVQSWTPDAELTGADIVRLREADDCDAADVYDARLQRLERTHKTSFVERGLILCEVEDRRLWAQIVDPDTHTCFTSFEHWVVSRAPVSRSHAFAAMRAIRELRDVPMADLKEMPQFAIRTMQRLSSAVRRDPGMIAAAKTMCERDLEAKVVRDHPEQHFEACRAMPPMRPGMSARRVLEEMVQAAMWVYDVTTQEDAWECVAAYFMDGRCEREGESDRSNREAYQGRLG